MAFKKIDAPSIKELFLAQIEEIILSGELKPNDRLDGLLRMHRAAKYL